MRRGKKSSFLQILCTCAACAMVYRIEVVVRGNAVDVRSVEQCKHSPRPIVHAETAFITAVCTLNLTFPKLESRRHLKFYTNYA